MGIAATILSWIISFLPVIWWVSTKGLPKLVPMLGSLMGRKGIIGAIVATVYGVYRWVKHLSIALLKIKLGYGILGKIFSLLRLTLWLGFRFPVIMGITLVGSMIFPGLLEKVFLLIGAVSIKIGLTLFGNVMELIKNSAENNTDTLITAIGDASSQLPPCMVDVLGYLHVVEDLGLIVGTILLIMIYNFVVAFAFKFIK